MAELTHRHPGWVVQCAGRSDELINRHLLHSDVEQHSQPRPRWQNQPLF